jgi:hypothetical protein
MSKPKRNERQTRLHLKISEALKARIEELRCDTGAATQEEVVRRAVELYGIAVDESVKRGGRLVLVSESGRERDLLLLVATPRSPSTPEDT